jgi:hypothetical protein
MDFNEIKAAAAGQWQGIVPALTPLAADVFERGSQDHPCPLCKGRSVIWPADDAKHSGRIACRTCTSNKPTGDGIATVAAFRGCSQGEAAKLIAEQLGIGIAASNKPKRDRDIIGEVCSEKRMPREAFEQFGPTVARRGKGDCVRVPVYNEVGEQHSHFDLVPGQKGFFAKGRGMAGMFFPGRLPKPGETWLLVEGVKDAAALVALGFDAAGLPSCFMPARFAKLFVGCDVVLVPDLDVAGRDGSQQTGGNLSGVAASVRVARLPGEIVEKGGADVRDVIARHGAEAVQQAIADAEPWHPREVDNDAAEGKPEIEVSLALGRIADQVTASLGNLGWESGWIPPARRDALRLFHRGGALVHLVRDAEAATIAGGVELPADALRIRPLPVSQLPLRIADAVSLFELDEKRDGTIVRKYLPPPRWLVEGVFSRGDYGRYVRRLEGVITAPTIRPDGTILQAAGYDPVTGLYFDPGERFPQVPTAPTREDAKAAADQLLEVVADFPFIEDADRSGWLALLLSLIGRQAITGPCPLIAITATTRGSGKSLLADAASLIAFGRAAARRPFSDDDAEMRKAITATAIEALPAVLIDNVDRRLGGASLDAALTATTWTDRVLGSSKTTGEIPLRTVWTATGNNLSYGADLARRVLPVRLAPSVERPEDRTDFTHPSLLSFIRENRPQLAVAALTMLRAYFNAGLPDQGGTWGSFESWHRIIRGAIVWAGLADPMTTRESAEAEDTSLAIVRGLIGGLLELDEYGDGLTAREIAAKLAEDQTGKRFPAMREAVAEVAMVRGAVDPRRLGNIIKRYQGRIANGFAIRSKAARSGVVRWTVKPVSGGSGGSGGSVLAVPTHEEFSSDPIDTHIKPYGNGLEVDQPDQPDPPEATTPPGPVVPCPRCGARMVRLATTEIINGFVNYDCPTRGCGNVKPVRVEAVIVKEG